MTTDDCGNDFAAFIGRNPKIDHMQGTFWCAAERFYNFQYFPLRNNAQDQRCLGPHNSHWYMYDYALQLQDNYRNVSTFSYLHPNTAHEASGTVVETLDADTAEFLSAAMERHKGHLVVFVMGDHGMRYGAWFTQINGSHEHRLPALFLVSASPVLDKAQGSREILDINTKRLVSKYDLHTTLLHLADLGIERGSAEYLSAVCETSTSYRAVSLLMEAISKSRSCEDVNIPSFWCSCIQFSPQSVTVEHRKMVSEALVHINAQSHAPPGTGFGVCKRLTLSTIVSVSIHDEALQRYYKFEFTVQESFKARFEMLLLVSRERLRKRKNDGFGCSPFFSESPSWLKVMYVARLDAYAGICKTLALEFSLDPVTCICESMETVDEWYPAVVDSMLADYVPVAATNNTCSDACEQEHMDCDEFAQVLLNECFVLLKYAACDRCFEQEKSHLIANRKEKTCVTARSEQAKCAEEGWARYCPCKRRQT